ncbi:hypothetical protein [Microcoleus sp. MON2_D5]|uniref:hypothetical protein n=1 Tax=Microcoleus sp. MON2_D5 TaxID=2818833 RepID=UPI002FD2D9C4
MPAYIPTKDRTGTIVRNYGQAKLSPSPVYDIELYPLVIIAKQSIQAAGDGGDGDKVRLLVCQSSSFLNRGKQNAQVN